MGRVVFFVPFGRSGFGWPLGGFLIGGAIVLAGALVGVAKLFYEMGKESAPKPTT